MSTVERRHNRQSLAVGLGPKLTKPFGGIDRATYAGRRREDRLVTEALHQIAGVILNSVPVAVSVNIYVGFVSVIPTAVAGECFDGIPPLFGYAGNDGSQPQDSYRFSNASTTFTEWALKTGICDALSTPILVDNTVIGAINVFAEFADALGTAVELFVGNACGIAATLLALRQSEADERAHRAAADGALDNRVMIEQAKGILMDRFVNMDAKGALRVLTDTSIQDQLPLHEVAKQVVGARGDRRPQPSNTKTSFVAHVGKHLRATVNYDDGALIVRLRGDLDAAMKPIFDQAITQAINEQTDIVHLDLSQLMFVDASGIGAIVTARNSLRSELRELRVINVQPGLEKLLRLVGLLDALNPELVGSSDSHDG